MKKIEKQIKKLGVRREIGEKGMKVTFTTIEAKDPDNVGKIQIIELTNPIKQGEKIVGISHTAGSRLLPYQSTTKVKRITDPEEKKFHIHTEISILEAEFELA